MVSSIEVAAYAGVSRSAVSQILNGHTERFSAETVVRVREAARSLDYRPSHAGRSLRRGRSDVVVTLVHERTFGPQLWTFLDALTEDLSAVGLTHLLQLASTSEAVQDAVLGLRPLAVVSTATLPVEQHAAFSSAGITVVEAASTVRESMDLSIGALQAAHLGAAGYSAIVPVRPALDQGYLGVLERERGAREWAAAHGVAVLPTVEVDVVAGGTLSSGTWPSETGFACYNDEVALATLGVLARAGLVVPDEAGVVGADDSTVARLAHPSLTTVRLNLRISLQALVQFIVSGEELDRAIEVGPPPDVEIVQGGSTRTPA